MNLGTYDIGPGAATVNMFDLAQELGHNPAADQLFFNILKAKAALLSTTL